jgi:hypothetical protein
MNTRREAQIFLGFGVLRDAAFPLLVEYTFDHKETTMAERLPQTLANHVRWQPPFHFFVLPVTAIALILAVVNVVRHYDSLGPWALVLLALAATVAAPLIRINALKAQDRVIRLEERMRLASILNEPLKSRIGELTEPQLIALRFCSDAELPGLVDKSLNSRLSAADIKKSIVNWRADTFRV